MKERKSTIILMILLTAVMLMGQVEILKAWMVWDLSLIKQGELWRLVTSSFTHLHQKHLALNLLGFWLIVIGFDSLKLDYKFVLFSSFFVGIFICFVPEYSNVRYSGFSGVLQGLIIVGGMTLKKPLRFLIWFIVVLKVILENVYGAPESTIEAIKGAVAVKAHLAGVISGVIYLVVIWIQKRKKSL